MATHKTTETGERSVTHAPPGGSGWTSERAVIVGGLLVGVVLGLAGNISEEGALQNQLLVVSSIGLTVASVLLALREARHDADLVAAGFAVFAIAEIVLWTGGTPDRVEGIGTSFPAAMAFYVPALLLISLPSRFALWSRIAGALAAIPFGIYAVMYLIGVDQPPEVLEAAGYLLLTVAVIGWVVDVVRSVRSVDDGREGARAR